MYRVYILTLLAIASLGYALDNALVSILRADQITDTQVDVSWQPIYEASNYKVFYDQSSDVAEGEEPLFDTDSFTGTTATLQDLRAGTDYTVIVHGYNALGREVGKTLPLHLHTFQTIEFDLLGNPQIPDTRTLNLEFSGVPDLTKSTFSTSLGIEKVSYDPQDMRKISISLKNPMKTSEVYDIDLSKIVSGSGKSLPVDAQIHLKFSYAPDPNQIFDNAVEDAKDDVIAPVVIDTLPQTGPTEITLVVLTVILSSSAVALPRKKKD